MQNARNMPQVNLRIPESLKNWLKVKAEANRRSVNSEAVFIIERYKQEEEKREQETKAV